MPPNSNPVSAPDGVAIIGMSGRFPGASTPTDFWRNLANGIESINHFSIEELEVANARAQAYQPNYVRARATLAEIDRFDAEFFGIYPQEANVLDPQHRIFLECSWEAIEDAGYDVSKIDQLVGVFAGCSPNSYFLTELCTDRAFALDYSAAYQVGHYTTMLGTIPDTLATRAAYKLNLRGPAITLVSACSTSLVAICQACTNLLTYQCDMALSGGVSITLPQKRGYLYQQGGMVSPDGHCRSFDQNANGTVFGSGCGVVLLKRLSDAVADGDSIYAVIKGFAVNNDGASKVGFTAPSVMGQAAAIAAAQAMAGVDPDQITYIEAHGTGTPLGDPIEVAALTQVFRATTGRTGFCALGTAKTNVGHLDVAAGVTGLIKTALSLKHQQLPGLLHFEKPNPKLDLDASPFYVNRGLIDWKSDKAPRIAGVSAFGVGGTNAHVVVEEAPAAQSGFDPRRLHLLPLSARSPEALEQAASRLASWLAGAKELNLADVAYTLQVGRQDFEYRTFTVASNLQDAAKKLAQLKKSDMKQKLSEAPVYFLFPGQGAQYPGMGLGIYTAEPLFRQIVDQSCEILRPILGEDLRTILFPSGCLSDAERGRLNQTQFAQCALFVIEYALARLWMSWGIAPAAMIGHSVGEFVCACLAGVFPLEDALALIARRALLMQQMPAGSMLSVRLPETEISSLLPESVSIAAVNAPSLTVVSGPTHEINSLADQLECRKIACRRLHTSHAFHSSMVDAILNDFYEAVRTVPLNPPERPYVSCVTGAWITEEQATDAWYWARHCRLPVRFGDAVSQLLRDTGVFLEIGPGRTLQTLARQQPAFDGTRHTAASSLSGLKEGEDEDALYRALGTVWQSGIRPNWQALHPAQRRLRVSLPTYPFQRRRFWIDHQATTATVAVQHTVDEQSSCPSQSLVESTNKLNKEMTMQTVSASCAANRQSRLVTELVRIMEELSGLDSSQLDPAATFLELGFDSLFLTQVAQTIQKQIGASVTFRQLLADFPSIETLAAHLDQMLPPSSFTSEPAITPSQPNAPSEPLLSAQPLAMPSALLTASGDGALERLFKEQVNAMTQLMTQQIELLRGAYKAGGPIPCSTPAPTVIAQAVPAAVTPAKEVAPVETAKPAGFGPFKPLDSNQGVPLTLKQRAALDSLIERCVAKTGGSKALTAKYRPVLADPRVVSGFRSEWKEIVYPIVCQRSRGSRFWDVDGNEYIDLLNGFGPIAFGHMPEFVREAVLKQLDDSVAIGPQTPLAGEVAELFCELTGMERVTFCNTGSEAVMAAIRIARTVTGRKKVMMFSGDYHGNFDEVLSKRAGKMEALRSAPAAPGITPEAVSNTIVLDYGAPESIEIIRQQANELAAVLVEPVQSRHPNLQPREFLKTLREITSSCGAVLIFDEVVTGFRIHQRGAQGLFGIEADLATYGKILGGGFPIGALAGKATFMNALDGGLWNYGDHSFPEAGVTFFAGTFVRHPLAMAAARAVLKHIQASGPSLQEDLNFRSSRFAADLTQIFERYSLDCRVESCGSLFYLSLPSNFRFGSVLFYHLRLRGIHLLEGFPYFLTTAHTDADLAAVTRAFEETLAEMRSSDLLPEPPVHNIAVQEPADAPLTEPQLEIWLSSQLSAEAACAYNESVSIRLTGPLDEAALRESLQEAVGRHQALRATIDADRLSMRFAPSIEQPLPILDLSVASGREQQEMLSEFIDQDARTPFDLTRGPLVRASLVRLNHESHVLVFTAHHIVCDGWSMNVIVDELGELYSARCRRTRANLSKPLAFGHYALNHRAGLESPSTKQAEQYWLNQFAAPAPILNLPTDRLRPSVKSFAGSTLRSTIDQTLYEKIKRAGARQGATLFGMLLAGFEALLFRLTGQDDIVVGIPAAAQSLLEGETLVGHCVNFLPLRSRFDRGATFHELVSATKQTVLDAYEHQGYTYGTLVRKLGLVRDPSRLPLVEVQFNLERVGTHVHFDGLSVKVDPNSKRAVNFDLFFNIVETPEGLIIDCDFNTVLFEAETIQRWLSHYENLLHAVAENPNQPLASLPILSESQKHSLIFDLNRTEAEYANDRLIHELISEQAARTPKAVAVVFEEQSLSYSELEERSNQLAAYLIRHGVTAQSRVAICMNRSSEMLQAVLAVLKCGAIYIPLDPALPRERIQFILEEAETKAVITRETEALRFAGLCSGFICLDADAPRIAKESKASLSCAIGSDALAYIIYTSGSTGKPKGVEISHRSVVNFLSSMRREPGINSEDRLLAVTTLSFDIAGLELFLPLMVGAGVVIASSSSVVDGLSLRDLVSKAGITIMQATPATWRLLLEAGWAPSPNLKMLCGGEALPRELANRLLAGNGELWNMYGPTETTIWSAVLRLQPGAGPVPVGPPIANTTFYVVDANGGLTPPGVPGELWIGGDGVARGYYKRPQLTSERFTLDPFRPSGERVYKTGDLVKRLADGTLEFLGRLDHQVKIRGFRIELGEIEGVIAQWPGVRENVAVVLEPAEGDQWLVSYIAISEKQMPATQALRDFLAQKLPAYMIPSLFVRVDELPKTPNGKIDRRSLPVPREAASSAEREIEVPQDETESKLAEICSEILGLSQIGRNEDLFRLGADSLKIFQIVARAARAGINITAPDLLQSRTIAAAASAIESGSRQTSSIPVHRLRPVDREKYLANGKTPA